MSGADPLSVTCTVCAARLLVKPSYAGRTVGCPKCQALITVPMPEVKLVEPPALRWQSKVLRLCKKYGLAAKFAASTILSAVIPGSPAVIALVEMAFDSAHKAGKDDWEINLAKQLETTADNQARLGQMLDILGGDLQHLFAQAASLQQMPDVARQMIEVARSNDARFREAVQRLDGIAHRFDRLERQNDQILASQEESKRLLEELAKRPVPPPPPKVCESCNGSGACHDCMGSAVCSHCGGAGRRRQNLLRWRDGLTPANIFPGKIKCYDCKTSGRCGVCRASGRCIACKGTGSITSPDASATTTQSLSSPDEVGVALVGFLVIVAILALLICLAR